MSSISVLPMGERALLLRFGDEISIGANRLVAAVCRTLDRQRPPWLSELVPAYGSVLVAFHPDRATEREVHDAIDRAVWEADPVEQDRGWTWEVPTVYGGSFGPDLETVSLALSLSPAEVVQRHTAQPYRVFALGFAPGFGYMGILPASLRLPRRADPRTRIPSGSVAMAERQTSVFPVDRPSGWHLIGWTPVRMFRPNERVPFVLAPGDHVRFRAVASPDEASDLSSRVIAARWKRRTGVPVPTPLVRAAHGRPILRVFEPGHNSTVQDHGRERAGRYGMPAGGAMDPVGLRTANLLAGNFSDAPALESVWKGPTVEAIADCWIGLAGARVVAEVGGEKHPSPCRIRLRAGERLKVGSVVHGLHVYLAVSGGFASDRFLGSAATYVAGQVGGFSGGTLRRGAVLSRGHEPAFQPSEEGGLPREFDLPEAKVPVVRATLGPHADLFSRADLHSLFGSSVSFSAQSDRQGLRLDGVRILPKRRPALASFGMARGAIQVPASGGPIVLAADAHAMGGYPVVAVVVEADFSALAQIQPGEPFRLREVNIEEAREASAESQRRLSDMERWAKGEGLWGILPAVRELAESLRGRGGTAEGLTPRGRIRVVTG